MRNAKVTFEMYCYSRMPENFDLIKDYCKTINKCNVAPTDDDYREIRSALVKLFKNDFLREYTKLLGKRFERLVTIVADSRNYKIFKEAIEKDEMMILSDTNSSIGDKYSNVWDDLAQALTEDMFIFWNYRISNQPLIMFMADIESRLANTLATWVLVNKKLFKADEDFVKTMTAYAKWIGMKSASVKGQAAPIKELSEETMYMINEDAARAIIIDLYYKATGGKYHYDAIFKRIKELFPPQVVQEVMRYSRPADPDMYYAVAYIYLTDKYILFEDRVWNTIAKSIAVRLYKTMHKVAPKKVLVNENMDIIAED